MVKSLISGMRGNISSDHVLANQQEENTGSNYCAHTINTTHTDGRSIEPILAFVQHFDNSEILEYVFDIDFIGILGLYFWFRFWLCLEVSLAIVDNISNGLHKLC